MVITEGDRDLFIGAKVTLDEKSPYWEENYPKNPRGIAGKVTNTVRENEEDLWWRVVWDNGEYNSYQDGDLKVLGVMADES